MISQKCDETCGFNWEKLSQNFGTMSGGHCLKSNRKGGVALTNNLLAEKTILKSVVCLTVTAFSCKFCKAEFKKSKCFTLTLRLPPPSPTIYQYMSKLTARASNVAENGTFCMVYLIGAFYCRLDGVTRNSSTH